MLLPKALGRALLLLACFTSGALASVTLSLVDANANYPMGGVYTSSYSLSVNGGSPALMICDDFLTDVWIGLTWPATVTSLSSLQGQASATSNLKFDQSNAQKQTYDYATEAVLAAELISLGNYANETAGEISFAIWGIFDPVLLASNPTSGLGHLTSTELTAAQQYLDGARAVVDAATTGGVVDLSRLPRLTIYTPIVPLGPPSQEFLLVSVDEAPLWAALAADLLGLAALVFFVKRRRASAGI
jgi:hypothetical protein